LKATALLEELDGEFIVIYLDNFAHPYFTIRPLSINYITYIEGLMEQRLLLGLDEGLLLGQFEGLLMGQFMGLLLGQFEGLLLGQFEGLLL
jgi:hypothetical protein